MKSIKKALLITATIAIASANANAALIDNNFYTTDSGSGLDWLDVTATKGLSYDYVSSQFGAGEEFAGWRYATDVETEGLYVAFGLPAGYTQDFGDTIEIIDIVNSIITMKSYIDTPLTSEPQAGESYGVRGLTGFSREPGVHSLIGANVYAYYDHDITHPGSSIGSLDHADYLQYSITVQTFTGPDELFDNQSSAYTGSYLVRTSVVPVPAAVWLFSSGLIGLVSVARKKTRG